MPSLTSKLKLGLFAAGALSLSLLVAGCAVPTTKDRGATMRPELALREAMRKLWEEHITWTRLVIVSTAAGLPDLDATTQRLLKNQTDIGNAIKPYYGEQGGTRLSELLREHIIGAANILAAAKKNDQANLAAAKTSWYANADTIAAFLNGANPKSWPLPGIQSMMREHLDLTLAEAVDQLQGRYPDSVADYDKVHAAILTMADMLSNGIIEQFPKQF
jgi:hypothetical protein